MVSSAYEQTLGQKRLDPLRCLVVVCLRSWSTPPPTPVSPGCKSPTRAQPLRSISLPDGSPPPGLIPPVSCWPGSSTRPPILKTAKPETCSKKSMTPYWRPCGLTNTGSCNGSCRTGCVGNQLHEPSRPWTIFSASTGRPVCYSPHHGS